MVIHSVNDLISVTSDARRKMSLDSFQKAKDLRNTIDNELYKQALKGQNYCLIDLHKYQDSDPCGYIINNLVGLLIQEGFEVEYKEISALLTIKW
jgi:hypothetical protein